jgi:hypothetical protein
VGLPDHAEKLVGEVAGEVHAAQMKAEMNEVVKVEQRTATRAEDHHLQQHPQEPQEDAGVDVGLVDLHHHQQTHEHQRRRWRG